MQIIIIADERSVMMHITGCHLQHYPGAHISLPSLRTNGMRNAQVPLRKANDCSRFTRASIAFSPDAV